MTAEMSYPQHARALLKLGVPLIGGHLAGFAVQVTDTLMLGWYDVTALAAVVLAGSLYFTLFIMGSGFAFAIVPLVAAASERPGSETQIRRVTRMGFWISMAFCALALVPLLLAEQIFLAMGQPPELAAQGQVYLDIAAWGLVPALGTMVVRSYLSALERTNVVLWVTALAALVNAGVNYLLIFGAFGFPELGIRGAAIASVAVHTTACAGLAIYALRSFPEHELLVRLWRPDWNEMAQVFRLGWPICLTNLAEVGMFSAAAIMIGWVGTVPLAAHGIALQLAAAAFMIQLGLSNAATVRIGKALGRGAIPSLRREARTAIGLCVVTACVAITAFLVWPEELIGLFLSPDDPEKPAILAVGVTLLAVGALFQMADGLQVVAHGLLRGAQDTRGPMVISGLTYWVLGLSCSYVLGFSLGLGPVGVWLGLVLGLFSAAALLLTRFWKKTLPRISATVAAA